jgi:hypothetical protein
MKKPFSVVLLALIAISLLTISSVPGTTLKSKKQTVSVEGTWQLISYRYGSSQSAFIDRNESLSRTKVINKTHFIWVDVDISGKVVQSAGGRYTLAGEIYTEYLDFGLGMDQYLKSSPQFTIKVEGDMLFQSGLLTNDYRIEEIWKRVK